MRRQIIWKVARFSLFFAVLWLTAGYNFLLAHTIIEMIGVVTVWSLSLFIWNARPYLENKFLLFIGISCLFTGFFQLCHAMACEGIEIFRGATEQLSFQFLATARLVESGSLLASVLFANRNIKINTIRVLYLLAGAALCGLIFGGGFTGYLPQFQIISELSTIAMLLCSILLLHHWRDKPGPGLVRLLSWYALLSIVSGLLILVSLNSQPVILSRHILRLTSWYLLYRAIIITGFVNPYDIFFRYLNRMKEAESEARKKAEERAAELDALRANLTDMLTEHHTGRLLESILVRSVSLLKAEGSELGLYDRKRNEIVVVAVHNRCNRKGIRIPLGHGLLGVVAQNREPALRHGYGAGESFSSVHYSDHWQSVIAAPLIAGGNLVGVLMIVESNRSHKFTWADLNLFTMFAQQAAMTIRNTRLLEAARKKAETDSLTGLFNHRHFFEAAAHELNRAIRYRHPLSALMIDIDHFKSVNDNHGHASGDRVLIAISNLCRQLFRNIDIIGRYGGEEFVVLLPETPVFIAREVAERLRKAVAETVISCNRGHLSVTISVGIAPLCSGTETTNSLIEKADLALYRSKHLGRNRITVWTPYMRSKMNPTGTTAVAPDP
ncbi:MAG: diguanylate cyclase [Fibrobacter sp.]|nr:diguanylate cyclase [Fibrobacter sp.]